MTSLVLSDVAAHDLVARHRELPSGRAQRLAAAHALLADPTPLARALTDDGEEATGAFHTAERTLVRELDDVANGERAPTAADFAFWLAREAALTVAGEPLLDCAYVDRELSLRAGRSRLRLDLLLVNAHDRAPVLAEVKLRADKDPFAALLQVLAAVALLGGEATRRRLRESYPDACFASGALDAMVLLVEPRWRGRDWTELLVCARDLASALTAREEVARRVRRITFLTVERRPGELWRDAQRV